MNEGIRKSLTENGLVRCIAVLEGEGINTIEDIRHIKIGRLSRLFIDDDTVEHFNDWRRSYKEVRDPFFFERLNRDPALHNLSVVARVDMISEKKPVISTVESVFVEHLMAASTEYVPMVSLIGGTGSGKSFLTSSFMPEGSDSTRWPTVAVADQRVPTTAHVCIFKGKLRTGSERPVNLLDLEGESRHTPKTLVTNLAGMAQAAASSLPLMNQFFKDTAAARAKIIKHTMPRMAYLLSDVVIFVDTIELRRDEFIDRVKTFALEAHKSCNSVGWRPALILISNKWSPEDTDSVDADQTQYYEDIVHDLSPTLFSQVAVMRIPCANACRENPDLVTRSIDQLHLKVDEFSEHVRQLREHHKCLYGEKKTWLLFREVVKWVNRDHENENPIKSLAELYENMVQKSSVENCLQALGMYGEHRDDSALFLRNVSDLLRWYAYLVACDRKLGLHGETEPAEIHSLVLDRCYAVEQCTATHTAPDGKLYHCRQNCQGHEDFHSNPAVVHVPAENLFLRFFGATDARPVRWSGSFSAKLKPEEHKVEYFLAQVKEFASTEERDLLGMFSHFQPQDLATKALGIDLCCLCLTSFDENATTLSNCHHILCEKCVTTRQQLSPAAVCVCPFCCKESPCPTFVSEEFVGFRVLSLDGGGVKGLVEIRVMQKIEEFFFPLKITNLFDVIVGTSVGGIVAMALQKQINLERIAAYMEDMAKNVLDVNSLMCFIRWMTNSPTRDTTALEETLKELFGERSNFTHNFNQLQPPHIYCTAFDVLANETALLGSCKAINRVTTHEERKTAGVGRVYSAKLWEAARATSAAPTFFSQFHLARVDGCTLPMVDGGIGGANCPAHLAMRVAKVLQRKGDVDGEIDMCLSLGTGTNAPNLAGHEVNGLTWAGKLIDSALDSECIWREKCFESTEFNTVRDRIRINPPNLGSLHGFSPASIPLINEGMENYFKTDDVIQQMEILYHTMYAKLWHVHVVQNLEAQTPYTFSVSLRDLRFDFDKLEDVELRRIISDRSCTGPPTNATHAELIEAAKDVYVRKPVVADMEGHFGCEFNGVVYQANNRAFIISTEGLSPGACKVDVYWETNNHRISVSGFPTLWNLIGEPHK